jgi:hypothetical protein
MVQGFRVQGSELIDRRFRGAGLMVQGSRFTVCGSHCGSRLGGERLVRRASYPS